MSPARSAEALREGDTAARMGGDESAVLLPDATPHEAGRVAARLREILAAPLEVEGRELSVGASVGLALAPEAGCDGDVLLREANGAMYRAKRERAGLRAALA